MDKIQNILHRPIGITLVALVAAAVWLAFPFNPAKLALLAVGILFIIGLKEPIWAMAALLLSQLSIPGYYLGPLTLRLFILIVTAFVLWRAHIREKIQFGDEARRFIIPAILLLVITVISNLYNSTLDYAIKDFRYLITGVLIAIFLPAAVKNVKDLKILGGVAIIGMTISAIVALVQSVAIGGRARGISPSSLQFSYILSAVLLVILGILLVQGIRKGDRRLLIPAALMVPALYFTYTRSALVALAFGLVALFLFLKTRIRSEIILLVIIGFTILISMTGVTESLSLGTRSEAGQEASSITRKVLWQAGIAIALDNPLLGIGGDQFTTVSEQYSSAIDPSLIENRYFNYETLGLGRFQIHNDFLRMWVYYGPIALIAFLWIIFLVLRNCIEGFRRSKQKFIKGFSIGLAAGLVSYCINAFYHNVMADFSLFWLITGFSLAVIKLTMISKGQKAPVPPQGKIS